MPNWCHQQLLIRGDEDQIKALFAAAARPDSEPDESPFDLNKLVPLDPRAGKEIKHTNPDTGQEVILRCFSDLATDGFDGFAHAIETWGSKWGANNVEGKITDPSTAKMWFDSAWSPVDKMIETISSRYPKLLFVLSYTEEANFFCGYQMFNAGSMIKEWHVDMKEWFKDAAPSNDDVEHEKFVELETKMIETLHMRVQEDQKSEFEKLSV